MGSYEPMLLQSHSRKSGNRFSVRNCARQEPFQEKWEPVLGPELRPTRAIPGKVGTGFRFTYVVELLVARGPCRAYTKGTNY